MSSSSGWSDAETKALVKLWGDERVQAKLRTPAKKKPIFDTIAVKLSDLGYHKTGTQCQTKIKNMVSKYRKVKDTNRKSGNGADDSFVFFDEFDSILGTRVASDPPNIIDSGVPAAMSHEGKFN